MIERGSAGLRRAGDKEVGEASWNALMVHKTVRCSSVGSAMVSFPMDPLCPAAPRTAYFDGERRAWILSHYADVLSALREPALEQERTAGKRPNKEAHTRAHTLAALPQSDGLREWRAAIESSADGVLAGLPAGEPVDLIREVIRPWSLNAAILALPDGLVHRARLLRLGGTTGGGGGFSLRRKLARAEFELMFRKRPGEKSSFIGISETLPAFLANASVGLLRHPEELARLRTQPELTPSAVEELLRYGGLVHSLMRRAARDVTLCGLQIARGDRVVLKLSEANRDPAQFPDPNRLDITRKVAPNLALGHGEHACVGAAFLRTAAVVMLRAIVKSFSDIRPAPEEIEWHWGDTLVSPAAVPVILRR